MSGCLLFSEGIFLFADFSQVEIALGIMMCVVSAGRLQVDMTEHDLRKQILARSGT